MMSKKKSLIVLVIILVFAIGIFFMYKRIKDKIGRFDFEDNKNIEMLNELNKNFKMPEDYTLEIFEVDGIAMEWVVKKDANPDKAILQLHGGAYTRSLKDNGMTYRRAAVQYARISGAAVLTVDYRVAPKDPYPAALEDALLAYNWLLDNGFTAENIIIVGDSAGGGLALAIVLFLRDNNMPMPAGLITMSAWTNLNYKRRKPAYVGNERADNPYISPVYGEYHDFPPMLMQAGGDEIILNDTLKVAAKAKDAGVLVTQTTYPGMFHVFQMLFPELEDANKAWEEVEKFITNIFYGNMGG
jgi:monoterpene epsilon-lactone hydrolase